ncbi:uncharacterized protein HaLaN_08295, partial [Haematococcus lacustris]
CGCAWPSATQRTWPSEVNGRTSVSISVALAACARSYGAYAFPQQPATIPMTSEYGKAARNVSSPPGRSGPYDRQPRQPMEEELEHQMYETPANSVKVSATTEVRELANTIGQAVALQLEVPALLTIGHQSINQAIKGIAAAASDLKATVDLTFQPAFRHENRTKPLIAFYLAHQRIANRIDVGEEVELTATKNQKIVSLAGAIAGKASSTHTLQLAPHFSTLRHHFHSLPSQGRPWLPPLLLAAFDCNHLTTTLLGRLGQGAGHWRKVRELKRTHVIALGPEAVTNAVLAIGNARLFLEKDSTDIKVTPEFVKVNRQSGEMNAIRAPPAQGGARRRKFPGCASSNLSNLST